jgi:hypothetical protein
MITVDRTYDLFIGSDNGTHTLRPDTLDTVESVMSYNGVDGYTVDRNLTGAWKGAREESLRVTVSSDIGTVRRVASALASRLNQDSVGIVDIGPAMEFVGSFVSVPS